MKARYLIIVLSCIMAALTPAFGVEALADVMDAIWPASTTGTNCADPRAAERDLCEQMEAQILGATVRLRIDSWVVREGETGYDIHTSMGHATLMDDRYLVTHNHFSTLRSIWARDEQARAYGVATLYDGYGRRRYTGPMSDFEMIWQDAGTLVIKAKDPGLFTELGFRPVAFENSAAAELEAGMEVAQVDWDGRTTRVDWTTIQEIAVEGGDPTLVLADGVLPGASGGGVFRLGAHIGNNRSLVEELNAAGGLIDAHSIVALNGGYFR